MESIRKMARCGALLGSLLLVALFVIAGSGWEFGDSLFSHLCHQKSDRCFVVGTSSLAVCSRCLGIYIGITGGCAIVWLKTSRALLLEKVTGALLACVVFANLLDFGLEGLGFHENAIWIRSSLGLLLGTSISLFVLLRSSRSIEKKRKPYQCACPKAVD